LSDFPSDIDAGASYVVYSHGLIVEGENPTPVHPRWGTYDFPGIKSALAGGNDYHLVAHHRPENTEIGPYVERIVSWVRLLISKGVRPERITLIGFSRGGEITARAASELRPLPINTALLATCWQHGVQSEQGIKLSGRFLSIFETTDGASTCEELAGRSIELTEFDEVAITTGEGHGAFYRPRSEWTEPLLNWLRKVPD
jgi:dienelactone hydrolase